MTVVVHRADSRGRGDHGGWLKSRFSFSFADWYEPTRLGFGALRVINDDTIAPASGFPPHSHADMEILTIVTAGAVSHKDSLGNTERVPAGDVQVMSAGTGVTHAEYNESSSEELSLFQIWITPKERSIAPRYAQKSFASGRIELLVSPRGEAGSLAINQDAYITRAVLAAGETLDYKLHDATHGVYLFILSGSIRAAGATLGERDALGVTEAREVRIEAVSASEALILEVPGPFTRTT